MSSPIAATTGGPLAGLDLGDVLSFRGIPYAAPPVGTLRWAPPLPAPSWTSTRDATAFGPMAMQSRPVGGLPLFPPVDLPASEDCLYLNVWTPATDTGRRPVMVWMHGGAYIGGTAANPLYDGAALCRRGNIVVVSINARLGAFGFLHFPGPPSQSLPTGANFGLLDILAALTWVRENVSGFGGDPGNVTLFGESSGSMAVATLLGAPAALGLFHRAITQSGAADHTMTPRMAAKARAMLCAELGLEPDDVAGLVAASAEDILAAQGRVLADGTPAGSRFGPCLDGDVVPSDPIAAIQAGSSQAVSLLCGTNKDEFRSFGVNLRGSLEIDDARLRKRLGFIIRGEDASGRKFADVAVDSYRNSNPGGRAYEIYSAIMSDQLFRFPTIRLAEAQSAHNPETFMYQFDWASPSRPFELGACHALELPFVFGTLDLENAAAVAGNSAEARTLSHRMMDAWISFASTGNPGHAGLPPWPAYDSSRRSTMHLSEICTVEFDAGRDGRLFWEAVQSSRT
jgi:para-nitrobenzyl esterase